MRIYLDSNVFRYLKKPENKSLYELIVADRNLNYYYFSEAHIQDLIRDQTDQKFDDIEFMATIVERNCWHYGKNLELRFRSPREYYDDYEWNPAGAWSESGNSYFDLIKESFRAIPLQWQELINVEQLPPDFPEDLRPMLLESVTMLDFMEAMHDVTDNLSKEQPRFKRLLQYLHRAMVQHELYEKLGIKGFDGKDFTDWDAFAQSFKEIVYQKSHGKELYDLITGMQYSLDIYGILKGRPKKQKFMSLLNDGKHTYFAGHAHILVTDDADMIAKSGLIYKIWEVATIILTPDKFGEFLLNSNIQDNSVAALFSQFDNAAKLRIVHEEYTLEHMFIQKELPMWYACEFNFLFCAASKGAVYYYFKQYFSTFKLRTITVELERVVNKLVAHFGIDELGQGKFDRKEVDNNEWKGREWRIETGVLLRLNDGMVLSFFKAAPAAV